MSEEEEQFMHEEHEPDVECIEVSDSPQEPDLSESDSEDAISWENGKQKHKCKVCPMEFSERNDLVSHRLVHTVEKSHRCEMCYKTFYTKSALMKHWYTHVSEKPYQCEHCEESFITRNWLKRHQLTHATGGKPYECKICQKGFRWKQSLKYHLLSHMGKKPTRMWGMFKKFLY